MQAKILIADDQTDVIKAIRLLLKPLKYSISSANAVEDVLRLIKQQSFDMVLMDMNYVRGETSGEQGLDLLTRIQQIDETLPVVVMTAWGSVELAVEAMQYGARDFLPKPWKNERLLSVLTTQVEFGRALRKGKCLEQEISDLKSKACSHLIAESPAMIPVLDMIARVGPSDANVLITGENGCGKGVVAQALHRASPRKEKSMVTVNTASIPETMFESELFGHVAGAFTDAKSNRIGRFTLAHEGTLFLDEIASVPVQLQSKLLRVLENGEFESIGSSKTCEVNVRILSATNADLDEEVTNGRFRQDLLYRLNTIHIHLPPLRDRKEDIPLLANHFLAGYTTKYRKAIAGFDADSLSLLTGYHWPGNVRELAHAVERAVLMSNDEQVHVRDLGLQTKEQVAPSLDAMTLEEMEQWAIRRNLDQFEGDITKVAAALGLSRGALYRRLEKYGLGG